MPKLPDPFPSRHAKRATLAVAGALLAMVLAMVASGCGGKASPRSVSVAAPPSAPGARPDLFVAGGGPEGAIVWALSQRLRLVWQLRLPGGGITDLRLCGRRPALVALRLNARDLSQELVAWRPDDGRLLWKRQLAASRAAIACAPGSDLFLVESTGAKGAAAAISAKTGAILWRVDVAATVPAQVAVDPGRDRAYFTIAGAVAVVSLTQHRVVSRWPLPGGTPAGLALAPSGHALAVSLSSGQSPLIVYSDQGRLRGLRRLGPQRGDLLWWPAPNLLLARSARGPGAGSAVTADLSQRRALPLLSLAAVTSGPASRALTVSQERPDGSLIPAMLYALGPRGVAQRLLQLPPEFDALAARPAR